MNEHFKAAPMAREVKLVTALGFFVMAGGIGILYNLTHSVRMGGGLRIFFAIDVIILLFVLIWGITSIIQRYEISGGSVVIVRLFGRKEIRVGSDVSVETGPHLLKGAMRVFGNGGFFSISGIFYSSAFGKFRAYVTDPKKLVKIKSGDKTFIISPENPDVFVNHLRARLQ